MSRNALCQWICLRAIKPRTQSRTLATTPDSTEDSKATQQPPITPSPSDLKSYLQSQDPAFLRATKSHLSRIHTSAKTAHAISQTLPKTASTISLLSDIGVPPYTTITFRLDKHNLFHPAQKLLHQIEVLNNNLTDLEYTPYPSESGPNKAEKFKKKLSEWSHQEKVDELEDLRAVEVSHAGRLMRSTEGLKQHVEKLEALGKRKNPFARNEGEDGNAAEVKKEESKKAAGFGAGATDIKASSEEHGKMPNPFVGTAKTKDKKTSIDTAKAKEEQSAKENAKAKDKALPKVADAVDVPKPAARRTLADLQKSLDSKVKT